MIGPDNWLESVSRTVWEQRTQREDGNLAELRSLRLELNSNF